MEANSYHPPKQYDNSWLWMVIPIIILVAVTASAGLFFKNTYAHETISWATQGRGQDLIDLVLAVPILAVSSALACRGSKRALLILIGALLYVTYSYVLYSFFTHFGPFFLLYVAVLGLSFYSLVLLIANRDHQEIKRSFSRQVPARLISTYLIFFGVMFCLLWLKEIVPALISGTIPPGISDTGLPINPVHVLDLAFLLPAMIITAVMLWRSRPLGYVLAAPFLVFAVLMGLAIISMAVAMSRTGVPVSMMMAIIIVIVVLISFALLVAYLKTLKG